MCRSEQTANFTHNLYISAVLQQISPERVCEMSRTSAVPTAKKNNQQMTCTSSSYTQLQTGQRSEKHHIQYTAPGQCHSQIIIAYNHEKSLNVLHMLAMSKMKVSKVAAVSAAHIHR